MQIKNSPWGQVQKQTHYADGIDFVSTASHGGFILSPERVEQVKAKFPGFTPWGGADGAYEEDCDAVIVISTFPEFFRDDQREVAARMLECRPDYYKTSATA